MTLHHKVDMSVIIITWNRKNDIIEMLNSLTAQTFKNFDIIVVDQASVDGSSELIAELFPCVRVIRLPENIGVAGGRNIGISNTEAEIVVILDDDAILGQNGLQVIYDEFQREPSIGIIGGKVVDYHTGELQRAYWPYPEYQLTQSNKRFITFTFAGGVHALKTAVLKRVGNFDETIFFGPEEYGLSMRVVTAGYKIIYSPDLILSHKGSARLGWGEDRYRLFIEGRLILLILYCPGPILAYKIVEFLMGFLVQSIFNRRLTIYWDALINVNKRRQKLISMRSPIAREAYAKFQKLERSQRGPFLFRIKNELFRRRRPINVL
jgi:GT2 family glycosyltransferase